MHLHHQSLLISFTRYAYFHSPINADCEQVSGVLLFKFTFFGFEAVSGKL